MKHSVVHVTGGLGNQLFQLSFAKNLYLRDSSTVGLDLSYYSNQSMRFFEFDLRDYLGLFHEVEGIALTRYLPNRLVPFVKVKSLPIMVIRSKNYEKYLLIRSDESYKQFSMELANATNRYFSGTFASPLYWNHSTFHENIEWVRSNLLKWNPVADSNLNVGIAIHARRGDLVSNPKTRAFHGFCGISYFTDAIDLLAKDGWHKRGIRISSDDESFAQVLANHARTYTERVELLLPEISSQVSLKKLSESETFIGSNSTFSWWAGYLQDKHVRVFPKQWFLSKKVEFEPALLFPDRPLLIDQELEY